jgi:polyisoprenoid-binding protein YceI
VERAASLKALEEVMKRLLLTTAALFLFCASSSLLWGEQVTVQLEPAATHVEFTLGDTLHTVHGSFRLKSGAISFDPATGKASGVLVVDAASGDSGSHARDGKMSHEILEAEKFPEITFTARDVVGKLADAGPSHLEVRGVFRIHGQDHALILAVDVQSKAGVTDAATKFEVPYVAWGMKNPSVMFLKVSDKVEISIQARARIVQFAASK